MNINTAVLKQSARMSSSIHTPDLSTLSGVKFDKFISKKSIAQQQSQQKPLKTLHQIHNQATKTSTTTTTNAVLMESNSITNAFIRKKFDNERRHSLSVRDERLLKVLSAPPDEPLYIDDNNAQINSSCDKDSSATANQWEKVATKTTSATTTTSSIVNGVVAVDDYENLPPSDEFTVAHNEG